MAAYSCCPQQTLRRPVPGSPGPLELQPCKSQRPACTAQVFSVTAYRRVFHLVLLGACHASNALLARGLRRVLSPLFCPRCVPYLLISREVFHRSAPLSPARCVLDLVKLLSDISCNSEQSSIHTGNPIPSLLPLRGATLLAAPACNPRWQLPLASNPGAAQLIRLLGVGAPAVVVL